jgi:lipoate-protein ligase A
MPHWRFLNTGMRDGAANMAVDEALLAGVNDGTSPPTVRVFGWIPHTVSIGYSQDPGSEIDLAACRGAGIGVVRRPTGGRAVFHADELTYSVVGPSGVPPLGSSIMETYRAIGEALVDGVRALGVDAQLEEVGTDAGARRGGPSPPCFVSSGRFEVVVSGRKLVGSAQRRVGRGVLQHGSLLLGPRHEDLASLLPGLTAGERTALRRALSAKTTTLCTVLGRTVGFDEAARAIRGGFERAWGIALAEGVLSDSEEGTAARLASGYAIER